MRRLRDLLTTRGRAFVAAGITLVLCGIGLGFTDLTRIGVLLVALPLICLMIVRVPRRRGEVRRQISTDLLAVGETSRVQVRFDLWAFGVPNGIWHDTLPSAVRGEATGAYPQDALRYDLEGVRRGISTLGPLMLRTTDPFGLAQREQAFGDTRTITVIPQTVALDPLPTKVGAAGGTAATDGGAAIDGGRLGTDAGPEDGARFIAGPAGTSGTDAGGTGGGLSLNNCAETGAVTAIPKSKAKAGSRRERPRPDPPVSCLPRSISDAFH